MSARGRRAATGSGVILAAALVGLAMWASQGANPADAGTDPSTARDTVAVEQRTLTVVEELSGLLGHGEERPIGAGGIGTLTASPEAGTLIERGDTLFEVNGAPVKLLYGEMPAWSELGDGMQGLDIEQLELNLVELGYGDALVVDEIWDAATTKAVTAWQTDAGMVADGHLELGEIVFEPGPVLVAGVDVARGGSVGPGGPVLRVTGTERLVTASLPVARRDGIDVGDVVELELGDGSLVDATVSEIDAAPTMGQDGSQTYGLRLKLDDVAADTPDGPVTISLVRHEREDALAVPVNALLVLLEGGYAVERMTEAGGTELVAVDVGLFADGWVQVTGDLAAGDEVVVP